MLCQRSNLSHSDCLEMCYTMFVTSAPIKSTLTAFKCTSRCWRELAGTSIAQKRASATTRSHAGLSIAARRAVQQVQSLGVVNGRRQSRCSSCKKSEVQVQGVSNGVVQLQRTNTKREQRFENKRRRYEETM